MKDDRLRKILTDRNKEIERLLKNGTLKGACYTKLATREKGGRTHFGWEITDLNSGQETEKRFGEKEGKILPSGTMIDQRDWFRPLKNVGVFKKED